MRLDNPQQQRQLVTWALNQVVRVIDELPQEEEEQEEDVAVGRVTCHAPGGGCLNLAH